MAIAIFPLVLAVLGILVYVLASNGAAKEVGRSMMWAGFFGLAFALAAHTVRLG